MRLAVAAVGRLKTGPEADLVADYASRIRASGKRLGFSDFSIAEIEAPKGLAGTPRQKREGELLLEAAPNDAKRLVLDETGKNFSSEDLSKTLAAWRDQGAAAAVFFIGGTDGHAESVKTSGDLTIAFGRATFPHLLVRAMLCEQIYRAMTILSGHPYHRS